MNWNTHLQEINDMVAQIRLYEATKSFKWEDAIKKAEFDLAQKVTAIEQQLSPKVAPLGNAIVVVGDRRIPTSSASIRLDDEYHWKVSLTNKGTKIDTTVPEDVVPTINGKPFPVASILQEATKLYQSAQDALAKSLETAMQAALVNQTATITNTKQRVPLSITVRDVTISPGWEGDFGISLEYTDEKTHERSAYEPEPGFDKIVIR